MSSDHYARLPLRERKKAMTRDTIIEAAERLFEERGFDAVTVAEIADAANVSVKTLFVYFRSKEELAFADTWLIDAILEAATGRPAGTTPAQATAGVLIAAIEEGHDGSGLDAYHRGFDSPGLQSGLLRMWSDYEDRLTETLLTTGPVPGHDRPPRVEARLLAMQAIAVARLVTSREVFDDLSAVPANQAAGRLIEIIKTAVRE